MDRPVAAYVIEYGVPHNVLNNAIRDGFRGKPWGLKAHKASWGRMWAVEQNDFDAWYQRYQANRQKRKKGKTVMAGTYGLDITNLTDEQKSDVSQRLHELQCEAEREDLGGIKQVGHRQIGMVYGMSALTVDILKDEGYDVQLWTGCGHCLQGMANTGGRCECECHSSAS